MIGSFVFDKKDIIVWENWQNKTYKEAKTFFVQLVDNDDIYTNEVGGTAKRARFESAIHTREQRQPIIEPEQGHDVEISSNERVQAYLDSFAEAASVNKEHIQEMKCDASSKDDQMAELIARMDARDNERDKQIHTKDRQINDHIHL